MGKVTKFITNTMIYCLMVVMVIIVFGSAGLLATNVKFNNMATIIQVIFYISSITIFYFLVNIKKVDNKYILMYVLIVASIARVFWMLNANTEPVSDFNTMYRAAQDLLAGDYSAFKGNGYIARFPHLTVMVLYFAAMIKFTLNPILVIKVINLILSIVTVYLIYKICSEVFENNKKALLGGYIAAVFPPLVVYVGVFCTENIAIPFYLLSIYLFLLYIKEKKGTMVLVLASLSLCVGNLFRMVAAVTLFAFICFVILYYKDKLKDKLKAIIILIIPFCIFFVGISVTLNKLEITEFSLWKGSEPAITNILKGTNIENDGRWNPEDAAIPSKYNYDYDAIEKASKEIIKDRLTNTPPLELARFYIMKIGGQWTSSDLEGVFWTELSTNGKGMKIDFTQGKTFVFQLVYFCIILLAYISLFNKNRIKGKIPTINLFYIIFSGYGISYLITETQGRYAYIVCWLFIIFAISGVENIKQYLKTR